MFQARAEPGTTSTAAANSARSLCHAASRSERRQLHQLLRDWIDAYYQASRRFLSGDRSALDAFPPGAFLPPLALGSRFALPTCAPP